MSNKLSYQIRQEAEELEQMAKNDPDNYFADGWREAAADLRKQAQAAYAQERDSFAGKTYNTLTDTWE